MGCMLLEGPLVIVGGVFILNSKILNFFPIVSFESVGRPYSFTPLTTHRSHLGWTDRLLSLADNAATDDDDDVALGDSWTDSVTVFLRPWKQ